jgi:hypothetical protein
MQFDHVKSLKNRVVDQCSKLDEEEAFITHSPNLQWVFFCPLVQDSTTDD